METNTPLWAEINAIVEDEELELYDIERRGPVSLAVYVRRPAERNGNDATQAGVTSDDCARVCRRLVFFFSAEGAGFGVGEDPAVEVSSPGVNRELRLPNHFNGAIGEDVKVVVEESAEQSREVIQGRLVAMVDDIITIRSTADTEVSVPFARIKRAHVDFKFE